MSYFQEPVVLKNILEPYTSLVFGQYFNTALLLAFGLLLALVLYFTPKRLKFSFVLAASIIFALISSTLANFAVFFAIVTVLYICSSYDFRLKNFLFWAAEGFMLVSNMVIYRIFSYHSVFYSFAAYYTMYRSVHYFVDVRQGSLQKIRFLDYISYLYFFPSFSHGPVERIENLNPEYVAKRHIFFGFKRIGIGIAKYLLLVYVLSRINPVQFSVFSFWDWLVFTAYAGAVKLYVLLSGDIDIVIGVSSLMGFRLSENFPKFPYIQTSLTKFWQNWQATIVSWLTSYVYFPLCRNRKYVYLKTMVIIMIIGWGHLFYNFRDFPSLEVIAYYTLWGVFLGGTLALSKVLEKKKSESRKRIEEHHPGLAKIIYADNIFTKALSTFITFNIIAIGWLSPLYILIGQAR